MLLYQIVKTEAEKSGLGYLLGHLKRFNCFYEIFLRIYQEM